MNENNENRAFILRLNERETESLEKNVVGIGWAKAENLQNEKDWEKFKQIIKNAYPEMYASSPRALGNAAGSIYLFIHNLKKGDYIVVPSTNGFYVGVLSDGELIYDTSQIDNDYAWRRNITWKLNKTTKPRNIANNDLQKRMKARQTCVSAEDLYQEIISVIDRETKITLRDDILDKTKSAIAESLLKTINDNELEKLIQQLATASGAKAIILPKNQHSDGDIDILATYDLKIAQESAFVKVAYQVKQHSGISDKQAIVQLIKTLGPEQGNSGSYDKACAITTADAFTKDAQELATQNDIILITRDQLVEWILAVGLDKISI